MLKASVYGKTDIGLVRSNNEDTYIAQPIWDNSHWLLVVIDGLGGYEGGEIAASIASVTILDMVEKYHKADCLDVIMQAVADANNAIFNKRAEAKGMSDMGCVITAAILDLSKKQLNVAHVGDTRLYQFNNHGLVKLTHDHSFVGNLEDEGHISEEDAMKHPRRNLIDRIVGDELKEIETSHFIEAAIFPVAKGDQFLLCSDGLSDMLTSAEISQVLQKPISLKKKIHQLIASANQHGGKDNVTAIGVFVSSEQNNSQIKRRNGITKNKPEKKVRKRNIIDKKNVVERDTGSNVGNHFDMNLLSKYFAVTILGIVIVIITILLIYTRL